MEKILFLQYPSWTSVRKAKVWLTENNIDFDSRHIINENPTAEELTKWQKLSGKDIDNFFSKNGKMFKELELKDKLPTMSYEEKVNILATDGKLCKRPLAISKDHVVIGFKEDDYKVFLNN